MDQTFVVFRMVHSYCEKQIVRPSGSITSQHTLIHGQRERSNEWNGKKKVENFHIKRIQNEPVLFGIRHHNQFLLL